MDLSSIRKTLDPSPDILRLVSWRLNVAFTVWRCSPFPISQIQISSSVHQAKISDLLLINRASLGVEPWAEVWKDALQWPVKISQVLTTPPISLEIAMPSMVCRLISVIGVK